jgi:hypothetical protein
MVRIRARHLYKNNTSPPTLDPASPLPPPPPPPRSPHSAGAPSPSLMRHRSFSCSLGDRRRCNLGDRRPRRPNEAAASATGGPPRSAAVSIPPSPPLWPGRGGQIRRVAVGSSVWRPNPWPDPTPHLLRFLFLTAGGGGPSSQAREAELLAAGGGGPSYQAREVKLLAVTGGRQRSRPWDAKLLATGGGGPSSRPR